MELFSPQINAWLLAAILALAAVAQIWGGSFCVRLFLGQVGALPQSAGLPRGGLWIGRLERILILIFVLDDSLTAIGFLVAAKSIFRLDKLRGAQDETDGVQATSEYIILGTLASFTYGLIVAYVARIALLSFVM